MWTVRGLSERDLDAVLAIQAATLEIAQWTRADYARVAAGEMAGWVAELEAEVAGFLVARLAADELEILNLAVLIAHRRRGVATQLLEEVRRWGRERGAKTVHLEVRASNSPARLFYEKLGFAASGRRAGYYSSPADDALLLSAPLDSPHATGGPGCEKIPPQTIGPRRNLW